MFIATALAEDVRQWQAGNIVRAEEPKRRKPEIEVWNPWLTHWYTIETSSKLIKATEMIPAGIKRRPQVDVDRQPPMSFKTGEQVKFAVQEASPDPGKPRELYVVDRKGKEHVLTIDEILKKRR